VQPVTKVNPPKNTRRRGLIGDMWLLIKRDRKFWLIPLIVILLLVIGLLVLAGSAGPLAPFLYPLL
jgi:Family of unknown function (DUF5989)